MPVEVWDADGSRITVLNETTLPAVDGHFDSLGTYRFEKGRTTGRRCIQGIRSVVIDAVQFLSEEVLAQESAPRIKKTRGRAVSESAAVETKELEAQIPAKETYITVNEAKQIEDAPIHIRRTYIILEMVARGFTSGFFAGLPRFLWESGRVELAQWITSDSNPLTARVYANRVWGWLMGIAWYEHQITWLYWRISFSPRVVGSFGHNT